MLPQQPQPQLPSALTLSTSPTGMCHIAAATVAAAAAAAAYRRVAVAVYSHFGPGKFPDNWWLVFTCVVVYCVINTVLTIFGHIKEGKSFLITHPKPVRACLTFVSWMYSRCSVCVGGGVAVCSS
jgi:hypothetical protein